MRVYACVRVRVRVRVHVRVCARVRVHACAYVCWRSALCLPHSWLDDAFVQSLVTDVTAPATFFGFWMMSLHLYHPHGVWNCISSILQVSHSQGSCGMLGWTFSATFAWTRN